MRADITAQRDTTASDGTTAAAGPDPAELMAELANAGLVSVEVSDVGDITYGLTPQGQLSARLMAMSRQAHAVVLLGALAGASRDLD